MPRQLFIGGGTLLNALTRAADVLNEALVWLICGVDYMRTFNIAIVAALAGLSFGTAAKADLVLVSVAGAGQDTNVGMNFNSLPASTVNNAPASFAIGDWTFTNGAEPVQVNIGSSAGGAQPLGTSGNYLSVLGSGTEDVTFSARSSFSFFWGSLDTFNTITFDTTSGTQTFTGSQIATLAGDGVKATGCQVLTDCNRYFTFTGNGDQITGFSVSSSQNSFEFTNISAVPEPATWAMMILGFLGVGLLSYRKSSRVSRPTFRII